MTLSTVLDPKYADLLNMIMKKLGFKQKTAIQECIESQGIKMGIIASHDKFIQFGVPQGGNQ